MPIDELVSSSPITHQDGNRQCMCTQCNPARTRTQGLSHSFTTIWEKSVQRRMRGDWQATKVWWVTQRYHDTKRLQGGHKGTRTRNTVTPRIERVEEATPRFLLSPFVDAECLPSVMICCFGARWCVSLFYVDLLFGIFSPKKHHPLFHLTNSFFRVCRDVCFIIIIHHMKWRIPCFLRRIRRSSWEIAPHHPLSTNQGLGKEILTPATFDWLSVMGMLKMGMLKRSRPIAKSSIGGRGQTIERALHALHVNRI